MERTSSAKFDEMLSLQKSASDRTGLRYDFSSPSITSTSSTVFIPPANNVEIENTNFKTDLASENIDNGKSILGAPAKQDKKEVKNFKAKKGKRETVIESLGAIFLPHLRRTILSSKCLIRC